MRRFIVKLTIFLVLVSSLLAFLEAGFRLKPNVFKDKYEGLSDRASEIEVLVLGHSHAEEGVNPGVMNLRAFNMGFGYQNVYFDEYLLKSFIGKMPSLKCVVISASYFHFFTEQPDLKDLRGEDLFNTIKYHLYCDLDSLKQDRIPTLSPRYNLEILNNPPRGYFDMAKYYLHNGLKGVGAHAGNYANGFNPSYVCTDETYLEEDAVRCAGLHFRKDDHPLEKTPNYSRYAAMAQVCRQYGIPFVLVLFPVWHTYLENVPNNQCEVTKYLLEQLVDEYDNCFFLDYSRDSGFEASDFRDATHLNSYGADKMTKLLEPQITGIIADCCDYL